MIASERSLASAHQPKSQQQRLQPSVTSRLGKSKNGKPPVRPVKVYVLDPRTLQQQLEAYVGQKNKREAEAKEREKAKEQRDRESQNEITRITEAVTATRNSTPITSLSGGAEKSTSASSTSTATISISKKSLSLPAPSTHTKHHEPYRGEDNLSAKGIVTQQCITTTGFGLPPIPLVVTNGVALLEAPISHSSISSSSNGILNVTSSTTSSVTSIGASQIFVESSATGFQSKSNTCIKNKKTKKRKAKKRKFTSVSKEKDEEDDTELAYLRKQTTTRLGRVSRPVSQPHSPYSGSSRVPSPSNTKLKRKEKETILTNVKVVEFRCETCFETYTSQDKLNFHLEECQRNQASLNKPTSSGSSRLPPPLIPLSLTLTQESQQQQLASSTNDQGSIATIPQLVSVPESKQGFVITTNAVYTTAAPTTACSITFSQVCSVSNTIHNNTPLPPRLPAVTTTSELVPISYDNLSVNKNCISSSNSFPSSSDLVQLPLQTPFAVSPPSLTQSQTSSSVTLSRTTCQSREPPILHLNLDLTEKYFKSDSNNLKPCVNDAKISVGSNENRSFKCLENPGSTPINVNTESLVPTVEDDVLPNRNDMLSNVDLVPSSFTIPNSPSSQCPSPRFPSDNNQFHVVVSKEVGERSPERTCHSPKDPMLLHSRSPFPSAILDASLNSVSVSNFSIPEEGLCRGELFMDLGDNILENNLMNNSRMLSPSPPVFSEVEENAGEPLFASSPIKVACSGELDNTMEEGPAPEDSDLENEIEGPKTSSVSSPPQIIAPILNTEDANDGEIFQSARNAANYARNFSSPCTTSATTTHCAVTTLHNSNSNEAQTPSHNKKVPNYGTSSSSLSVSLTDFPKTPLSTCLESDISMDIDSPEFANSAIISSKFSKRRSVWQFVKEQINFCGISQACGEISEMAEKLSKIARDQFIPIREEEIDRIGNSASVVHVDTPFVSHLLDLPFGTYIFKEDSGNRKVTPPPPITSSELSFTCGVDDVEKFLPANIDLIALPHLTNLDLI